MSSLSIQKVLQSNTMINQLSDEYVLLAEITMLLSLAVWLFALANSILQAIKPHKIESFGLNANQRAVVLQSKKKILPTKSQSSEIDTLWLHCGELIAKRKCFLPPAQVFR